MPDAPYPLTMDLILCHTTADFDALGAAVGLTRLLPGSKIVLTGGSHPPVRDFLALHRDEYPLIERRSVNSEKIRSLTVVDTQQRDRLGKAAEWLDLPNIKKNYTLRPSLRTRIRYSRHAIAYFFGGGYDYSDCGAIATTANLLNFC